MPEIYIGLMSGSSLDGVDAVIADLDFGQVLLIAHLHQPFAAELRAELLALNHPGGSDEMRRAALAANELACIYAAAARTLLARHAIEAETVHAIGCHGQTVRHQPADGYTIQLVNGALLTELTGIAVVCDFRSRDVAADGQGAPLAPAFHQAVFASGAVHRVIVNIGGITNLTNLPTSGAVTGFDCGPGNLLLDAWIQQHLKQPFDSDGAWASSGCVIPELLARLLSDEYLCRPPPKSAGRESFNLDWLMNRLGGGERPADVQATLLALTARGIVDAIENFCGGAEEIYVCGGGARNSALVELLSQQLAPGKVAATDALGVDARHVEALAFAWLARQTLNGEPGNLPAVTGARGARILGAIYRA
ncbi:MAG: anhydro-N-acetylmuramic acid kinase [Betaproteobacteria bacterium]|nr:anhydro-N-acetylmuramic acid kinase [Betaproteobacteria bacterium]